MSLAVFDIDGVLADVAHRRHHLTGPRRSWDAFFAAAGDDPALGVGVALALRAHAGGHDVVYLSGRPERLRRDTERWLGRHGLPYGDVLLRPDADYSPAARLKLAGLRRLTRRDDIGLFVDDDAWVVDAVRTARPPLVAGRVVLADWQPGGPRVRRSLHQAQERLGRT
jgi:hypothetical protein